jgi:ketosteroid isomerase-like protein
MERGDMVALRELYHPDAVADSPEGWPEAGPFVGRDAIMRAFDQLRTIYEVESLEPISDFDHIADRVVVRTIWHGVGQGPELNMELTIVYAVRGGRIVSLEYFWDYVEALEAVGLRE